MIAIYKRELKSYFTSVIACLFIAVTTLVAGIFFVYYNLQNGLTSMYPVYQSLFILVFTVPILTMKIIADERRLKTDQLILTAPVSVGFCQNSEICLLRQHILIFSDYSFTELHLLPLACLFHH